MRLVFVFLSLCFCCIVGVFGVDADEVKSVSVMEGENVTLHNNETELQRDDLIQWRFGPQGTVIAKVSRTTDKTSVYADVHDGMFRDRLQVDDQTGSLTITDTKTTDTGLYQMIISGKQKTSYTFNVTVYGCVCCCYGLEALIRLVASAVVGVATVAVLVYDIRSRSVKQDGSQTP